MMFMIQVVCLLTCRVGGAYCSGPGSNSPGVLSRCPGVSLDTEPRRCIPFYSLVVAMI